MIMSQHIIRLSLALPIFLAFPFPDLPDVQIQPMLLEVVHYLLASIQSMRLLELGIYLFRNPSKLGSRFGLSVRILYNTRNPVIAYPRKA